MDSVAYPYSLNGRIMVAGSSGIPLGDRSFLLGDGCFTTARVSAGRVEALPMHLARLAQTCVFLSLAWPGAEGVTAWIDALLAAAQCDAGVLRITVSRGGGRGLWPDDGAAHPVQVALTLSALPAPCRSLRLTVAAGRIDAENPLFQHKTTSYLPYILPHRDAVRQGYDAGILCNHAGHVCSATMGAILVARAGNLYAPPPEDGALKSITVVRIFNENKRASFYKSMTIDEIFHADAVWVCTSVRGCVPVIAVDATPIPAPTIIPLGGF